VSIKDLSHILVPASEVSWDADHPGFLSLLLPKEKADQADVVIFGVPFDGGTFRHVGTNEGPLGIRKGFTYFRNYSAEMGLNFMDQLKITDLGNVDVFWNDYFRTFANVDEVMKTVAGAGQMPVMLGGDHSLTYQAVKSYCEATGKKLGLVWFDNHLDSMTVYHDDELYCGTPLRNILRELPDQVRPENVVHIGSRGFHNSPPMWKNAAELGFHVIGAEEAKGRGLVEVARRAVDLAGRGTDAIYCTVDIDVADAVYAPGTQCPRPGGFSSTELCQAVREVAKAGIVGFDIMEVAPHADVADVTVMLAASCVLEVLAALAWRRAKG
jgi:agmatinase